MKYHFCFQQASAAEGESARPFVDDGLFFSATNSFCFFASCQIWCRSHGHVCKSLDALGCRLELAAALLRLASRMVAVSKAPRAQA